MKILVLSDSHRQKSLLEKIISDNESADAVIFLGDGIDDFEEMSYIFGSFARKRIIAVRGNCDRGSFAPSLLLEDFGSYRFFITHGYAQDVKNGVRPLLQEMADSGCNVGLFGHTHRQCCSEIGGLWLFNPGSAANGDYGIICISESDGKISFEKCSAGI